MLALKVFGFVMLALFSSSRACAADYPATLQDLQIAGRILSFQEGQMSKEPILGIIYNKAIPESRIEADKLITLLAKNLAVGGLVLLPRLIEQSQLIEATGLAAIFATIGVEGQLLSASVNQHHILCLTRHLEQIAQGSCTVAISSLPSVAIVVNQSNAATAGVRFATAFRMMVREI